MGGQVSVPDGVHVVVVGGGFGGIGAAQQLRSAGLSFTLLDQRDAFHHNVAALRASVQPGFARRTFIPYADTFGTSFVQGRVERVDPERQVVVLAGGREVQYSHLILCTGTDGPFPGKFTREASLQAAVQMYEDFIQQVQLADSVLVVGGGGTGVEMAAEIKTEYPDKKVTPGPVQQVQSSRVRLLISLHPPIHPSIFTSIHPSLHPSIRLSIHPSHVSVAVFVLPAASMAENGALKVNDHLQVQGFSNVFAVGDCADLPEPKLAYHAGLHASVAVTNIINSVSGKQLTTYQPGSVTMLLAMGRDDGVGQFNGFRLPRWLVALGKSRDLLLWKSWREMQQTQPQ
uniref:Ferroptosis suppressor protein 1 n=1 Tax=Fundulus heteroclitus TaxID=8078 RepID=A0A3Q2P824_FUNHE